MARPCLTDATTAGAPDCAHTAPTARRPPSPRGHDHERLPSCGEATGGAPARAGGACGWRCPRGTNSAAANASWAVCGPSQPDDGQRVSRPVQVQKRRSGPVWRETGCRLSAPTAMSGMTTAVSGGAGPPTRITTHAGSGPLLGRHRQPAAAAPTGRARPQRHARQRTAHLLGYGWLDCSGHCRSEWSWWRRPVDRRGVPGVLAAPCRHSPRRALPAT
jgi:hypothetical protein